MEIDIGKCIAVDRPLFPTRWLAILSAHLDKKWSLSTGGVLYRSASLTLRWPRPVRFKVEVARYPEGSRFSPHIDETQEYETQFNCVVILKKAQRGGELLSERFIYNGSRLKIIQPNVYKHEVTRIQEGERLSLIFQLRFTNDGLEQVPF